MKKNIDYNLKIIYKSYIKLNCGAIRQPKPNYS